METQQKIVGLLSDPGLPEDLTESFIDELRQELSETVDHAGQWEVEVSDMTFPLTSEGDIPLMDRADAVLAHHGWDFVIYLTDLPRYQNEEPSLCEVSETNQAALVSSSALGVVRLQSKLRKLLVALVHAAQHGMADFPLVETIRSTVKFRTARQVTQQEREDTLYIVLLGWASRVRLLSGMVRTNRPGRMLPAMSGAIAAGIAIGSFGVFYSSVWLLADTLHPARLVLTSLLVIAALTTWLILRNGLWNKRREVEFTWQAGLDNVTTIIMVASSVVLMYLLLTVGLFVLAVTIIDASHFEFELRHPVSLLDYAMTAWMSASLGTLAGALGSNFDNDEKIRAATYSKRQHERRERTDSYNA